MTKTGHFVLTWLLARIASAFTLHSSTPRGGNLPIDPSWMPIDLSQSAPDAFC